MKRPKLDLPSPTPRVASDDLAPLGALLVGIALVGLLLIQI